MIELQSVTRRFGKLEAVRGLTLKIEEGEIFGLVGPDGAGKTTTLRMLCGLMDPTEGVIKVAGLEVRRNLDAVKDQIGYMAQKFGLYGDLTVEENMLFYSDLFGIDKGVRDSMMIEFLKMTRMTPFRDRAAAKLSGGMKQKLALMCTLLHKPRVLFLDEPTNGVDPLSRRDFWEILYRLAKEGMTILVSTAYLDEAERCDRVGLMNKGQLIRCDTPANLRGQLAPRCFRAEADNLREARKRLQKAEGVVGAEPAGAALHVYLKEGADVAAVEQAAAPVRLVPLEPQLEDVFIALIEGEATHAAA
jgi:ABC-2 type transport system ATP-binding protein